MKTKNGAASQAGDADSARAPGLTFGLQGSVNVHRGALLLVAQWQWISSFVFYKKDFLCYKPKYTKLLFIFLTKLLSHIRQGLQKYCETVYSWIGINQMLILQNSKELLEHLKSQTFNQVTSIKSFDFSTLYTTIPHQKLKKVTSIWHVKRCNIWSFLFILYNFLFALYNFLCVLYDFPFILYNFLFILYIFLFVLYNFHLYCIISYLYCKTLFILYNFPFVLYNFSFALYKFYLYCIIFHLYSIMIIHLYYIRVFIYIGLFHLIFDDIIFHWTPSPLDFFWWSTPPP